MKDPLLSQSQIELLEETDVRPADTVTLGVQAQRFEDRAWLKDAAVVPVLGTLGIAHAGVLTASAPYRIVRTKLSGAYFMATIKGMGRVFLNGKWTDCAPGQAVLLMPGILNAFYTASSEPWSHCWVRMAKGSGLLTGASARMQVVTDWNAEPLGHAVQGLRSAAMAGGSSPSTLKSWADLILTCVGEFRNSRAPDPRVVRLWDLVEASLSQPWTLSDMARIATLSPEQLRRLSRSATGRSPHDHLIHLRMKRASELLLSTRWTVARIAEAVGYQNAFVFSNAFKKVIGWPPSEYAKRL
ncbi:MAG: AraC family transcriptional regulator [Verrucomicrobiota bacterium]